MSEFNVNGEHVSSGGHYTSFDEAVVEKRDEGEPQNQQATPDPAEQECTQEEKRYEEITEFDRKVREARRKEHNENVILAAVSIAIIGLFVVLTVIGALSYSRNIERIANGITGINAAAKNISVDTRNNVDAMKAIEERLSSLEAAVRENAVTPVPVEDNAEHGWLGVILAMGTADNGTAPISGPVIVRIDEGSGAAKAGLKVGDMITKVDGEPVTTINELRYYLYSKDPGETVSLEKISDGESEISELAVTLGEKPQETEESKWVWVPEETETSTSRTDGYIEMPIGMTVRDGSIEGYVDIIRGAEVVDVVPGSSADKAGIREGDFICKIGDKDCKNAKELLNALNWARSGTLVELTLGKVVDGQYDYRTILVSR